MYFVRTPKTARFFYPSCTWRIKGAEASIFLTFDDGPDPEVTPGVLQMLDHFNAKATFFCVGDNAVKYPEILNEIRKKGHAVGNHSYSHVKGKSTKTDVYLADMNKSKAILKSDLLRPPYGSITYKQIKILSKENRIIMWSVLPGDFDKNITREEVRKRAISNTKNGDIVVFHDNKKFRKPMLYALEGFLFHFNEKGFQFRSLSKDILS